MITTVNWMEKREGTKVGSSIVLKVDAGDNFNIRVSSWYNTINGTNPAQPNSRLLDHVPALSTGIVLDSISGCPIRIVTKCVNL